MSPRKLPLWSALAAYLLGALWICCFIAGFWNPESEASFSRLYPLLFALLFFLWAGLTLWEKEGCREHLFWLVCALLIALSLALGRGSAAGIWAIPALHGFAGYWILARARLLTEGTSGAFLPLDLLDALVISPFGGFFLRIVTVFSALRQRFRGGSLRKPSWISLVLILAALPVLILAGNLLGQADESFRQLLSRLGGLFAMSWRSPRWLEELGGRFLLGLPVGAYLFGLVGTALLRDAPRFDGSGIRRYANGHRFAPVSGLAAVFCAFAALYLLFFAVQAGHLLGAFCGNVPGAMTASQYAREGFFQLCQVMAINFGLLFAAEIIGKVPLAGSPVLRTCADILLVQSVLLAVTAASKLVLYIRRFGFTPLRLLSMWAVIVLTAGCLLYLRRLRKRFPAMKYWIFFSAASFTLLCFF